MIRETRKGALRKMLAERDRRIGYLRVCARWDSAAAKEASRLDLERREIRNKIKARRGVGGAAQALTSAGPGSSPGVSTTQEALP